MADLLPELRAQVKRTLPVLTDAKLYQSAKWAAELLCALPAPSAPSSNTHTCPSSDEEDQLALARTFFDCKEFDRCVHALKRGTSPAATHLRLYATYLLGETKRERSSDTILSAQDAGTPNTQVTGILRELDTFYRTTAEEPLTALLYNLHGLLLVQLKRLPEAQDYLFKSVCLMPYNWSAWQELAATVTGPDAAAMVGKRLRNHTALHGAAGIMIRFFEVVVTQEFSPHNPQLGLELDLLLRMLPSLGFLQVQLALFHYHALDYAAAEEVFDTLLEADPFRLDDMDTYSNILYVREKHAKLSHLARFAASVDEFRPETCCIVANYYSLKCEHEKAIMYYRRALALNRRCLLAWTLMGHEFVELKNSHAAIESYRRAIDANPKDFRAWYGLGQAYEVLDMHLYSLYYYQRAASLKPLDRRMWQAIANCYEKLDKVPEAIKTYEKAMGVDEDPAFLFKLACLYERIGDEPHCGVYMRMCLDEEANGVYTPETAKARLWLAKWELRRRNYAAAYAYASEFSLANRGSSQDVEEARGVVRECKRHLARK